MRPACVGWLLLVIGVAPAFAQSDRATISGTIEDESGAVIPGVTVTAASVQTGQPQVAVTDSTGFYTFPNLRPGQYNLSAELQGFKRASRLGLQLDAAGAITIDFTLETGEISEEVTVRAAAAPLQRDVAVRKTVEAKDIELLSFSGRNPIGVVGLKAGVSGGNFNSRGFDDYGNGGFNINGSRPDENTIAIDGAPGIVTRSAWRIVGIQNVDAVQEVQVLTANYMPEYGRASGGQIRFITKGGSNRYSGSASYFLRDESLQANSWARNRSPDPAESAGPAPFNYDQYGYAFGGPVPGDVFEDRFFFFGAQEWVDFFQESTNFVTVPSMAMRQGDLSELLDPENPFFGARREIIDPLTGEPFPNNVIPADRLSGNGRAFLDTFPEPTPGFQQGSANAIVSSGNPRDQRKDTLRLDYRLNDRHRFMYRYSRFEWTAVDAFRGGLPLAVSQYDIPQKTQVATWSSTLSDHIVNELTYTHSLEEVFIDVFTGPGTHLRSRTGIDYPYIFPERKEIFDKIPTINIDGFQGIDGGPYPSYFTGPIHTWTNTTTWVTGRHTIKGGVVVEYSGEDDFDQINVLSIPGATNNQNGRFEFRDDRPGGTGVAIGNVALGLFSNYAEIGERAFTKWRALAADFFIQDSWRPTSRLTIEGGVRWALWPPWHSTTNNIANFDPRFFDPAQAPIIDPEAGRVIGGNRFNGIVLPGDGFRDEGNDLLVAQDPAVQALFRGEPRGFSKTHDNLIEPRLGVTYALDDSTLLRASGGIFHNRVTLNDSSLLGGNPPFQPMVSVANGDVDNPGGGGGGTDLPFGMTGQDIELELPTSYMWSVGVQRELPGGFILDAAYVGRRGLYLQRERNINQLQPGTIQANPDVNIAALRPFTGFGAIRLAENAGRSIYHSLQIGADRRYSNGLKIGVAYTLSASEDNASDKRDVIWNSFDDTSFYGPSSFDRRHVFSLHYIYDLPFFRQQDALLTNLLGGWQISGAAFFRSGTPFSVAQTASDIAGVGDSGFGQPLDIVGEPDAGVSRELSDGNDSNFFVNPAAFANPAPGTFGNGTRNLFRHPGEQQWDIALFKNFNLGGTKRLQFRAEAFNFLNHPNLGGVVADPTNASFGRVVSKTGQRDIQLSLRFQF